MIELPVAKLHWSASAARGDLYRQDHLQVYVRKMSAVHAPRKLCAALSPGANGRRSRQDVEPKQKATTQETASRCGVQRLGF